MQCACRQAGRQAGIPFSNGPGEELGPQQEQGGSEDEVDDQHHDDGNAGSDTRGSEQGD